MSQSLINALIGFGSAALATIGTIYAARFGLLGKREDNVYRRLSEVEKVKALIEKELFLVKTELTTFYMVCDYLVELIPDADKKIKAMLLRMKERREFLEAAAEGIHDTKNPPSDIKET